MTWLLRRGADPSCRQLISCHSESSLPECSGGGAMRRSLTFWTLLFFVPLPLIAQEEALRFERAVERTDELVQREMQEDPTPVMAVALTNPAGLLHLSTYGFADRDSRRPVTAETLFGLGSIGKSFTAVATLELHDEGKLD